LNPSPQAVSHEARRLEGFESSEFSA
jgi:hypothetical protein